MRVTATLRLISPSGDDRHFVQANERADQFMTVKRAPIDVSDPAGGRRTICYLTSALDDDQTLQDQLRDCLAKRMAHAKTIDQFTSEGWRLEFFVGLFLGRWNEVTSVDKETLAAISEAGGALILDMYDEIEETSSKT